MADAVAAAADTTTDAAAAGAQPSADSLQLQQDARKSKQPIKYVPPKPASGNPNFGPRKAWPGGSITVKLPKNVPPPGTHRWKDGGWKQQAHPGHGSAHPYTSKPYSGSSRLRAAGSSHGGGINMHSAVALQLQSAAGSRTAGSGGAASAGRNGRFDSSSEAPEPGEVPVGLRSRLASHPGAPAAGGLSAATRGSGLAQLYKQQQGSGSLLEAIAQRRGSGGSPRGGPPAAGPPSRRPSGGSPAFAEGYGVADKLLAALERNALQLANSHAAVIAAHPPGEEANALRHGFQSRIRRQQQDYADNAAYVAELDEYLAAAFGGGGSTVAAPAAAVKGGLGFGADSPGFGGGSVSMAAPAEGAWAAGDTRRGVGVLRHGSRRVEVVGGAAAGGRQVSAGGWGDNGMAGTFKGSKRKWPDTDAGSSRKVVAIGGGGGGGAGGGSISINPKFVKSAAAKAQPHAPKKQPAAALQQTPASVEQKLGMSLDAIAGKPANPRPAQQPAVKAKAAGGSSSSGTAAGGAAAAGSSRKHTLIAWQA